MSKQTSLRTGFLESNENISFPSGTVLAVQNYYERLGRSAIFGKHKSRGREGFFCLVSNKDLTLHEALLIYRQKDSIEKIFHSLKNEIEIKPLRCWSDLSIYGALIVGFLAQSTHYLL